MARAAAQRRRCWVVAVACAVLALTRLLLAASVAAATVRAAHFGTATDGDKRGAWFAYRAASGTRVCYGCDRWHGGAAGATACRLDARRCSARAAGT